MSDLNKLKPTELKQKELMERLEDHLQNKQKEIKITKIAGAGTYSGNPLIPRREPRLNENNTPREETGILGSEASGIETTRSNGTNINIEEPLTSNFDHLQTDLQEDENIVSSVEIDIKIKINGATGSDANKKDLSTTMSRIKIAENEINLIREEFSSGIPVERINNIIKNRNLDEDFIENLRDYYIETVEKKEIKLSLGVRNIDRLVSGFDNMVYLNRSISQDSLKKLEFLLDRKIPIIKDWKKPRRERISGTRIKISDDGIKLIREHLKNGLPKSHIREILKNHDNTHDIFPFLRRLVKKTKGLLVKIPITRLKKFITNFDNILYRGGVISENDFSILQTIIGDKNSILHEKVYSRRNEGMIEFVKNESHAELIGVIIARGSIRSNKNGLYISFNKEDHPDHISRLRKLIKEVFGRAPSKMKTRNRFFISGRDIIEYLNAQGLTNKTRKVPSWIKNDRSLTISCIKEIINCSGSIDAKSNQNRIEITISNSKRHIIRNFKELCNSLNIRTSGIKEYTRKDGRKLYYAYISSKDQVRRFLIDVVKPEKWDYIKNNIEMKLKSNGNCIESALESSSEYRDLRRKLFKHQKQEYTFLYNPVRIKNLKDDKLRDCYSNYINDIDIGNFPSNQFDLKTNIRPSSFKFIGEHIKGQNGRTLFREDIKTQFIKDNLVRGNKNIEIYKYNELSDGMYKDILDITRKVYAEFSTRRLGRPWHEPILQRIMTDLQNALSSEIPVWKSLVNGQYYVGHVDLNLFSGNILFVVDLKEDEVDILKSLPQIVTYGVVQKDLLLKKTSNLGAIDFKCIIFTKEELWVFDPEVLQKDIIEFVMHANNMRRRNLKCLPYSKGSSRTDLLEDLEKIFND